MVQVQEYFPGQGWTEPLDVQLVTPEPERLQALAELVQGVEYL